MKNSNTFSILFWINNSRIKNNHSKIYVRITVNNKRASISTKRAIDVSLWDSEKSRLKGNSIESRTINKYLEQVRSGLFEAYQELIYEKKLVTAQLVKARYLGLDAIHHSFKDLFDYHNKVTQKKVAKATFGLYNVTQKYVFNFIKEEHKTLDVYLIHVNHKFITGFENYLRNYIPTNGHLGICNNTAMKHMQRLKKMMKMALAMEWISKDPFLSYKIQLDKTNKEYLTEEELYAIETYSSSLKRLNHVKDLFIFGCYTGLAYIDIINLRKDNISIGIDKNIWIYTFRKKTNTTVKIPLLAPAERMIQKYTLDPRVLNSGNLFPSMSNQKVNSYLKEIADTCGITKNLTFHMARHTFATTITLSNGIPIETVSKMLGHTKLTTTQIYAKIVDKKVSEDMQLLRNKLSIKGHDSKYTNVS